MGDGVVINPIRLTGEIATLAAQGVEITTDNLFISSSANLILPHHISEDEIREAGDGKQGSTKSGIAQAYADKALRVGRRAEDFNNNLDALGGLVLAELIKQQTRRENVGLDPLDPEEITDQFLESAHSLGKFVTDTSLILRGELIKANPARVLAEGAQAFLLDVDQGMYPAVTSSSTTAGGVCAGLGVPPHLISEVLGVSKAIPSHVGGGPFVTEIHDEGLLEQLHGDIESVDAERGTTTGRTRRLGCLDLPQIRRAQWVNGVTQRALTKLDWVPRYGDNVPICIGYRRKNKLLKIAPNAGYKLSQSDPVYVELPTWKEDISNVRNFEDLPSNAQKYIEFIEANTDGVPIGLIGVGPDREQVIVRSR